MAEVNQESTVEVVTSQSSGGDIVRIAVIGCCHGHLDETFREVEKYQTAHQVKIDLLICCGDFHAIRNGHDLECLACPAKYREMGTFYKYYSGECVAPVLTVFIGGNHEASNHLFELYYGGWVAPNIYYLGNSGVVNFAGFRIGGASGIFKPQNFKKGYGERIPYGADDLRSVFHTREFELFKLEQLSRLDIFISHDWPAGITKFGDEKTLLKWKPFFGADIQRNALGNPNYMDLLYHLKPQHWFSAHMHVRFTAEVKHTEGSTTRFLALDKCEPRRRFFEVLQLQSNGEKVLSYDPEWLAIVKLTHELLNFTPRVIKRPVKSQEPVPPGSKRVAFKPIPLEIEEVKGRLLQFNGNLQIPLNFQASVPVFQPRQSHSFPFSTAQNNQTLHLLHVLDIPNTFPPLAKSQSNIPTPVQTPINNSEEILLDMDDTSPNASTAAPSVPIPNSEEIELDI